MFKLFGHIASTFPKSIISVQGETIMLIHPEGCSVTVQYSDAKCDFYYTLAGQDIVESVCASRVSSEATMEVLYHTSVVNKLHSIYHKQVEQPDTSKNKIQEHSESYDLVQFIDTELFDFFRDLPDSISKFSKITVLQDDCGETTPCILYQRDSNNVILIPYVYSGLYDVLLCKPGTLDTYKKISDVKYYKLPSVINSEF